jgi:hypothetical protein
VTEVYRRLEGTYCLYVQSPRVSQESGRAVAEAVSRWLPTAAARVRARVWSCGICGGQSGAGAGFLRVLRFPLPTFIPLIAPQSPWTIIWGWYNRPVLAAVQSGFSLTPPIIIIIIIIIIILKEQARQVEQISQRVCITTVNRLMLFSKITAICCEDRTEHARLYEPILLSLSFQNWSVPSVCAQKWKQSQDKTLCKTCLRSRQHQITGLYSQYMMWTRIPEHTGLSLP